MEMAHFKKYSSFSEKRYAFVRVKWQISVQPLHNIIILIIRLIWSYYAFQSKLESAGAVQTLKSV